MSIRCGFFNSINNDRTYDANDMGKIFEGIISDGIFYNIGNNFNINKINNSLTIKVLTGKAWFYNKYFEITADENINISPGSSLERIDAICIKIDNSNSGRLGSLYVLEGSPDSTPSRPIPTNTDDIKYIVIGYIKVPANAQNLNNATITSNVGTRTCPWSETTLDPRHGMYIYEGESAVDPYLNEYREYNFNINLSESINNSAGQALGKKGSISLQPSDLGCESFDNIKIIANIITAKQSSDFDIYNGGFAVLYPLYIQKTSSLIKIGTKYMDLNQAGEFNIALNAVVAINVIVIELGGAQNE